MIRMVHFHSFYSPVSSDELRFTQPVKNVSTGQGKTDAFGAIARLGSRIDHDPRVGIRQDAGFFETKASAAALWPGDDHVTLVQAHAERGGVGGFNYGHDAPEASRESEVAAPQRIRIGIGLADGGAQLKVATTAVPATARQG